MVTPLPHRRLFPSWPHVSIQGNKHQGVFPSAFSQNCCEKYWAETRQQWHFDLRGDVQQLCVSTS